MEQHELFKSIYASNLKSRAINVMSCLITYMNSKDNTCFPAIKTIAKCCSMGVSTVKRALADLVEAGFVVKQPRFIEKKNGAQTSNLYRLSAVFTEPQPPKDDESSLSCLFDQTLQSKKREIEQVTFESISEEISESRQGEKIIPTTVIPKTPNRYIYNKTIGAIAEFSTKNNYLAPNWTGG